MAGERLDRAGFYGVLRNACRDAGGQSRFAEKHGFTPQFVSDVLCARREPNAQILSALGLRKVVSFERVRA